MTDRTRREYMRDLGIATGLIGAAGCLGSDNDSNSTPKSTDTATDAPTDTATATEEDNTTTDDETTTGDASQVSGLYQFIPANSELEDLREEGDPVMNVTHGYPSAVASSIGEQATSEFNDQDKIVPAWSQNYRIEDMDEKMVIGIAGLPYEVYDSGNPGMTEDATERTEIRGNPIYKWSDEQDNTYHIMVGEDIVVNARGDLDQSKMDAFERILDTGAGELDRYVETNPFGETLTNASYEHAIGGSPTPNKDPANEVVRVNLGEENYTVEIGTLNADGGMAVESTEGYSLEDFPLYLSGWG